MTEETNPLTHALTFGGIPPYWTVSLTVEAETIEEVLDSLSELSLPVFAPIKIDRYYERKETA